jgi:hypothetical protein
MVFILKILLQQNESDVSFTNPASTADSAETAIPPITESNAQTLK